MVSFIGSLAFIGLGIWGLIEVAKFFSTKWPGLRVCCELF